MGYLLLGMCMHVVDGRATMVASHGAAGTGFRFVYKLFVTCFWKKDVGEGAQLGMFERGEGEEEKRGKRVAGEGERGVRLAYLFASLAWSSTWFIWILDIC